jgi:hypothetical protein
MRMTGAGRTDKNAAEPRESLRELPVACFSSLETAAVFLRRPVESLEEGIAERVELSSAMST